MVYFLTLLLSQATYSADRIAPSQSQSECAQLLTHASPLPITSVRTSLIAYLDRLISSQVLRHKELVNFLESLERENPMNPIDLEEAQTSASLFIHREGLEDHLNRNTLTKSDIQAVAKWLSEKLRDMGVVRIQRTDSATHTASTDNKIEFHLLKPGTFRMGYPNRGQTVTLTQNIQAMSTPLTQAQWVEVMGENPAYYKDGESSAQRMVGGKNITLQPNHPVESITWWSAIAFANKLSELRGLPPTYDLTHVTFKPVTRAEDGSLEALEGSVQINAPDGNIYLARGIRLPTEAEQEYLLRSGGTANGTYHFGNEAQALLEYAWFNLNAGKKTHPVAVLKPNMIDGNAFYDTIGNVAEWSNDWYTTDPRGGINPTGPNNGSYRITRGGAWNSYDVFLTSIYRGNQKPNFKEPTIGVRFVQSLFDQP